MARRISEDEDMLVDDLDGSEAAETVHFGLDDIWYEVDLSAKNAERLRGALEEFIHVSHYAE